MSRAAHPIVIGAGVALAAIVLAAEWHSWWGSRREYPAPPERIVNGEDVVLVLGFPARRDGSPSFLQRWRTRIAHRSAPPGALYVFTGGAVHDESPEAEVMARYAESCGIPPSRIARETQARTTRENLAFSEEWLEDAGTIRIASNTFHALRARQYLRATRPDLWRRLVPIRDFIPFELGPFRLMLTCFDALVARAALRRDGPIR